jgi:hypothetical protein
METVDTKQTLDALLRKNQNHELATQPGVNNHVPMVLIALYRLGASPEQMKRYVERFNLTDTGQPPANLRESSITRDNWKSRFGQSAFSDYVEFFSEWMNQTSRDEVLHEAVPVLMTGVCTAAYHALLRLAYALDYGSRDEAVFALAYWAVEFYPGPKFNPEAPAVEPEALFDEIVQAISNLQIEPVYSIDGRLHQVYQFRAIEHRWKPVRISGDDPLGKMSELILKIFSKNQHFTLLHALTSCQALRLVLPYVNDYGKSLSEYWHSVCAAYVTVSRSRFEMAKSSVPRGTLSWKEVFVEAAASEDSMEHIVKLCYACWLESLHYDRDEYLALACREIRRPSPFL